MPRVRAGWKGKYNMDKHEFYTAYHYALQYGKWKDRYEALGDTMQGIRYDRDHVIASPSPDGLLNAAAERAELAEKIKHIEETAQRVAPEIYPYLLKGVTEEGISYTYLREVMMIPCGKNFYYSKRREFYWRLSRENRKEGHTGDKSRGYAGSVEIVR